MADELKGKAKNFLSKLFDSKPAPQQHASGYPSQAPQPVATSSDPSLISAFDNLKLSVENTRTNYSDPNFIGGFNPYQPDHHGQSTPHTPPRPPPMPVPYGPLSSGTSYAPQQYSMTMQHAIAGMNQSDGQLLAPHHHPATHSAPTTPYRPQPLPNNSQQYPFAQTPPSAPATPYRPPYPAIATPPGKRPRASSTPPSPVTNRKSSGSSDTQCAGITKAGKQCTRQVKTAPPLSQIMDGGTLERYCFQHTKDILSPTGFYADKKDANGNRVSVWLDFDDWIPVYLHNDTRVAIRVEMDKKRSAGDEEGYIYAFEIREPKNSKQILLKVGRTVNVVKRLHQWNKQCTSKEQVLRGWYPGEVDPDDDTDNGSLMKGRIRAGGQGVWCHRLERLIHLELADLAVNKAYLEPGWKSFKRGDGKAKTQPKSADPSSPPTTPAKPGRSRRTSSASDAGKFVVNGIGNGGGNVPCKDCGSIHKEIFAFDRVPKGIYKDREWEGIVKEVIDGWGEFVKEFV